MHFIVYIFVGVYICVCVCVCVCVCSVEIKKSYLVTKAGSVSFGFEYKPVCTPLSMAWQVQQLPVSQPLKGTELLLELCRSLIPQSVVTI